ncbi:MAG TPA: L,D-transpeptidase family protein [Solirubrobacteraceae bacterium]|jgi:lipoprotein-anchoring transpeptidase ErfK/SrfK
MRATILLLFVLPLAGCGAGAADAPRAERPATPAFTPAAPPAKPARPAGRYLLAHLRRRVVLRAAPGGKAVGRAARRTTFGTRTVLGVVRRRGAWLEVVATERPNGRTAWIRAGAARLGGTDYAIHVDRSARRLVLRRDGHVVQRMRVAVGRPGNETPTGRFAVTDALLPARADSPYGCCILALSGHQTKLVPGWPGGDRLAIHHTPQPETVGHPVSLGCLRARERDIRKLMRRVPLGTPVFIRA